MKFMKLGSKPDLFQRDGDDVRNLSFNARYHWRSENTILMMVATGIRISVNSSDNQYSMFTRSGYHIECVSYTVLGLVIKLNAFLLECGIQLLFLLEHGRLPNKSPKGSISSKIAVLSCLEELILDSNMLVGTIPNELGTLRNLVKLDLSGNRLPESIPSKIGGLANLSQLYLSNNNLSDTLPLELGNLLELRLDMNHFEGLLDGTNSSKASSNNSNRVLFHIFL